MSIKYVGIFFILLSILFSFTQVTFTGAVVGIEGAGVALNILSIVSFVIGIILLFNSSGLEVLVEDFVENHSGVVSKNKLLKTFDKYSSGSNVILDTSFLVSYFNDKEELVDYFSSKGKVIVPEEVISEFNGRRQSSIREFLKENTLRPDIGYKSYLGQARDILNMGEKAYLYEIVEGVLSGEDELPMPGSEEHKEYSLAINKLKRNLARNGVEATEQNLRVEAKKHWAVSDADAAILAVAMYYESQGEKSMIMEKDKDIEEAISYLKRVNNSTEVSYLNAYGRAA